MGTTGSTDREKNPATHAAPLAVKERKIVVLGCAKVGKTALTQQLVQDKFVPEYSPTIDQSHYKTIKLRGGEYLLEIVDTAGQDDTSLFQPLYTIGTHGYVLTQHCWVYLAITMCWEGYPCVLGGFPKKLQCIAYRVNQGCTVDHNFQRSLPPDNQRSRKDKEKIFVTRLHGCAWLRGVISLGLG